MSADSPSPQDVADAARKHVLSLPREELDSVTLRQIKRAVEKRLGMTEGTADAEVYASAVREAATSALTAAKSESEPLGQPQQQAQPRKREAESPPADQRQPAAKKAKTDGVPEKNADGAYLFELAPLVFAKAYKFKSFKMVDVRFVRLPQSH
jgi:hypothetical protein